MINIKSFLSIILFLGGLAIFSGCNENEFLIEDSRSELTVQDLYTTPEGFENALNGIFSIVRELERGRIPDSRSESFMGWLMNQGTDNVYTPTETGGSIPWYLWGDFNNSTVGDYESFFNRAH